MYCSKQCKNSPCGGSSPGSRKLKGSRSIHHLIPRSIQFRSLCTSTRDVPTLPDTEQLSLHCLPQKIPSPLTTAVPLPLGQHLTSCLGQDKATKRSLAEDKSTQVNKETTLHNTAAPTPPRGEHAFLPYILDTAVRVALYTMPPPPPLLLRSTRAEGRSHFHVVIKQKICILRRLSYHARFAVPPRRTTVASIIHVRVVCPLNQINPPSHIRRGTTFTTGQRDANKQRHQNAPTIIWLFFFVAFVFQLQLKQSAKMKNNKERYSNSFLM